MILAGLIKYADQKIQNRLYRLLCTIYIEERTITLLLHASKISLRIIYQPRKCTFAEEIDMLRFADYIAILEENELNLEQVKRTQDVATSLIENKFKDINSPSTYTKNVYKRVLLGNTERRHRKYLKKIIYQNSSDKQIRKTRHAHSYIITCPTRICPPPKEMKRSTRGIKKNHKLNITFKT